MLNFERRMKYDFRRQQPHSVVGGRIDLFREF